MEYLRHIIVSWLFEGISLFLASELCLKIRIFYPMCYSNALMLSNIVPLPLTPHHLNEEPITGGQLLWRSKTMLYIQIFYSSTSFSLQNVCGSWSLDHPCLWLDIHGQSLSKWSHWWYTLHIHCSSSSSLQCYESYICWITILYKKHCPPLICTAKE